MYIQDEIINKLLDLINKHQTNYDLINEILITLGSFSKGNEYHLKKLIEIHHLNEILLHLLCSIDYNKHDNYKLIESCLRCLKNLFINSIIYEIADTTAAITNLSSVSSNDCLYQLHVIQLLFKLFTLTNVTKECVINIFANTCETKQQQHLLIECGAIPIFSCLLTSNVSNVQLSALKFFTVLCYENREACKILLNTIYIDRNLCEIIGTYLSRDKPIEIQLYAAKCITNLCRCDVVEYKNALIQFKTLPTLIRLCQKNIPNYILLQSIATLTYLIELSAELQEIASYLEQIVPTLAHYVIYYSSTVTSSSTTTTNSVISGSTITSITTINGVNSSIKPPSAVFNAPFTTKTVYTNKFANITNIINNIDSSKTYNNNNNQLINYNNNNNSRVNSFKNSLLLTNFTINNSYCNKNNSLLYTTNKTIENQDYYFININLRLAATAFQALAALSANNEEVRRRVSDQDGLMNRLVQSIQQNNDIYLRLGALSLLHSLSRSVQQLRTKFLDHKVWTPIIDLIQSNDEHLICITTAIMANLLLEFSPSKEVIYLK